MTTTLIHLRISDQDAKTLDQLRGSLLSRNTVGALMLSAALKAVRDNPGQLKFPPVLSVLERPTTETHTAKRVAHTIFLAFCSLGLI